MNISRRPRLGVFPVDAGHRVAGAQRNTYRSQAGHWRVLPGLMQGEPADRACGMPTTRR